MKNNIEKQVERIIREEILACQTMLVNTNMENNIFYYEDIENIYINNEEKINELEMQIDDLREELEISNNEEEIQNLEEQIENLKNEEEEPQEIYEWWLVSNWLCQKLREIGEPLLDNEYGQWWGRTCCGQSIEHDGTIQEIISNLNW